MGEYTRLLFANPSFIEGASRILDFGDSLTAYNYSPNGEEADRKALMADWMQVGEDLSFAIDHIRRELKATGVEAITSK